MFNNNKNARFSRLKTALAVILMTLAGAAAAQSEGQIQTASANESGDYLIGPGDTLNVFVWRQEELSAQVPVRPDGQISTPLVEDMVAVGKTPSQLARDIESVLGEYIRSPQVTIIVEQFVGTFGAQIRVLGQVQNPGSVPYRENMTLLDVLLEVGGLTEFAAGNRSKLRRTVDGRSSETRIRLDNLMNRGDLDENTAMQPGDVIVVPESVF